MIHFYGLEQESSLLIHDGSYNECWTVVSYDHGQQGGLKVSKSQQKLHVSLQNFMKIRLKTRFLDYFFHISKVIKDVI